MTTRGRPRHPDILTPREWAVLELLRQRRTNEEIAEELGITLDGAKYHVSSILSKLGVASREEAAAWKPEEARRWTAARWALIAAGAGGIVAAVAGLALLAVGMWLNEDNEDPGAPVAKESESPVPVDTGPKARVGDTFDLEDLVAQLTVEGVAVADTEEVTQPFLSISGTALGLRDYSPGEHALNVFIYPNFAAREDDTARFGRDLTLSLPLLEWIAPAYGLSRANLFVVAVTDDPDLVARIERALGRLRTRD